MAIQIFQETSEDYKKVEDVVEQSFKNAEHTDHSEHHLVSRLRNTPEFIPDLSLVAKHGEEIVGHVLLTRILIKNDATEHEALALAPLAVIPEYQSKGVGTLLVNTALEKAKSLNFKGVIVLGHEKYYPRFGFKRASLYDIKAPFDVPDNVFMALELENHGLEGVSGIAYYSPAFFE